jgi:hypothetical protein
MEAARTAADLHVEREKEKPGDPLIDTTLAGCRIEKLLGRPGAACTLVICIHTPVSPGLGADLGAVEAEPRAILPVLEHGRAGGVPRAVDRVPRSERIPNLRASGSPASVSPEGDGGVPIGSTVQRTDRSWRKRLASTENTGVPQSCGARASHE